MLLQMNIFGISCLYLVVGFLSLFDNSIACSFQLAVTVFIVTTFDRAPLASLSCLNLTG